ncbi:hypothetical protein GJ744_000333 [Endocarpon pusillum]|uniref:Uncharacterized protein n=1 Tax=Endocarpon pusillum TaxID=364733 RepID=A0A8H7ATK7_9EURO|nr:hypothetical protein GJ744_000333 [Endocarpon pusillum]
MSELEEPEPEPKEPEPQGSESKQGPKPQDQSQKGQSQRPEPQQQFYDFKSTEAVSRYFESANSIYPLFLLISTAGHMHLVDG